MGPWLKVRFQTCQTQSKKVTELARACQAEPSASVLVQHHCISSFQSTQYAQDRIRFGVTFHDGVSTRVQKMHGLGHSVGYVPVKMIWLLQVTGHRLHVDFAEPQLCGFSGLLCLTLPRPAWSFPFITFICCCNSNFF